MDLADAAHILSLAYDLPEDEVDRAERFIARQNTHTLRLETQHGEENAA